MSEPRPVTVFFASDFKRSLRRLAKRYRSIRGDVDPLIRKIESGETPGDQMPGVGATVFKVRVANSDVQRGKSGGYRVLYYVQVEERVILLTIYSESDRGDISATALREILSEEGGDR